MSGRGGTIDVLYLAGLPASGAGADLGEAERRPFCLTAERVAALAPSAVVLSPMPVIDEVDNAVRGHPQVRFLAQSDRGVFVRMAILEHLLAS